MEEFRNYVKTTIGKLVGFTCIVAAVLALAGKTQYIAGWCAGNGINLMYFLMLYSRSARALQLPPERAVAMIRGGAVLRLVMIVLVLIVISRFPSIHFGAAAAGLFTYRLTIFADALARRIRSR